jgi:dolichol-phosphate mannosyltransferase
MNLPDTVPRLLELQKKINYDLELIFVDDGSKDNSLDVLLDFKTKYPGIIKIVKLTKNFGGPNASLAGFSVATGDLVGKISADLQDPPELFLDMIKHWEKGYKAVFAIRKERKDPLVSRFFSKFFYSLFRKFGIKDYPKGGFDFLLVDREVVDKIKEIKEKNTNINTLIFWLGYDHVNISYNRKPREKGKSRWSFSKKIKLFIDTFVGFSYFPIRLASLLGFIIALGSITYGLFTLSNWVQGKIEIEGWTTTIIILTFTAGIQLIVIGILGEYLWRIMDEVRKRPTYVIDKIY